MKSGLKIVTIGGGSSYTPELIEGYIKRQHQLPIKEIVLVDIEEGKEKLEIVGAMARRMVRAAGLDWKIIFTLNRFDALKDADFVTTQFRVGQLDARVKDERIPLSNGVLGQETNGPGGIFKAFRTIPVIGQIIDDMRNQCPNAWLINFTNPAGMVTEAAINHFGWQKTIGLCNAPINHSKTVMDVMKNNHLTIRFAGINHFHWHKVWDEDGQEITRNVIEKLYHPDNITQSDLANIEDIPYNYDQLQRMALLPCGYHRYYYQAEDMLEAEIKAYKEGRTRAQVVKETERRLFDLYKNTELDHKPDELSQRGGAYYSDAACEVIASIVNNKGTLMVVSTMNRGAITDLPEDSIVEVTSEINSLGAEPLVWGKFRNPAKGQLQLMKSMEEMVIEAAITGDYGTAMNAFVLNPLTPSGARAEKIFDQLLYAHQEFLPQFKERLSFILDNKPDIAESVNRLMETN